MKNLGALTILVEIGKYTKEICKTSYNLPCFNRCSTKNVREPKFVNDW